MMIRHHVADLPSQFSLITRKLTALFQSVRVGFTGFDAKAVDTVPTVGMMPCVPFRARIRLSAQLQPRRSQQRRLDKTSW